MYYIARSVARAKRRYELAHEDIWPGIPDWRGYWADWVGECDELELFVALEDHSRDALELRMAGIATLLDTFRSRQLERARAHLPRWDGRPESFGAFHEASELVFVKYAPWHARPRIRARASTWHGWRGFRDRVTGQPPSTSAERAACDSRRAPASPERPAISRTYEIVRRFCCKV
jgi:hypothetical protein